MIKQKHPASVGELKLQVPIYLMGLGQKQGLRNGGTWAGLGLVHPSKRSWKCANCCQLRLMWLPEPGEKFWAADWAPLTIQEQVGVTTALSLRERVLENRWSSLIGLKKIKIKQQQQQKGKKKQSNEHSQGSLILLAKELAAIHLKYFQNPPSDLRKGRCNFHFENPNFERQQINSPPLCPILLFKCSN